VSVTARPDDLDRRTVDLGGAGPGERGGPRCARDRV